MTETDGPKKLVGEAADAAELMPAAPSEIAATPTESASASEIRVSAPDSASLSSTPGSSASTLSAPLSSAPVSSAPAPAPSAQTSITSGSLYQRAAWKHVYRWILFVFLVGLDISMPMSLVDRFFHHILSIQPMAEAMQFGFLFLINCYFLPVCLFEVNYLLARGDELVVANLLWSERLKKGDIVSLTVPTFLVGGLLRTARCFYLINRADIPNFDELLTLIAERYL